MKFPAIAASSVFAAVMVFTALGPRAQHEVQRAVRNATHEWEAPLPPWLSVGINFALNEVGIPMLSRHCAAPASGPEAMSWMPLRTDAHPITSRGCPKPAVRPAARSGIPG